MADRGDISATEHARLRHSHVGRYVVVWIALLVFTALTYGVSRFHIPGGWGVTVALAIAIVKGGLVALFFMHLWDQRGANRLVFVTSLLFVALLIGGVISDNATRFALTNPPGTEGAAPLRPTDYEILERKPPQAAPRPH
jgi:cytochrome c oxidase subunit 4